MSDMLQAVSVVILMIGTIVVILYWEDIKHWNKNWRRKNGKNKKFY